MELHIINESHLPVCICWVEGENGALHHYYQLNGSRYINDGSVNNIHRENTFLHDTFVVWIKGKNRNGVPRRIIDLEKNEIVCIHQPLRIIENNLPHEIKIIRDKVGSNGIKAW